MKIKFSSFFCLVLLILSCDPLILENDIRVLVTGNIVDGNGVPISNAEILVYAKKGGGIPITSEINKKMLGNNTSDNEGGFSVTSILARDDQFTVEVKASDDYSLYVYQTNTVDFVPSDLVFNIPTITLNKKSTFNYSINKTSSEDNSIQFSFKYIGDFCFEVYDQAGIDVNQSICPNFQVFGRVLNNDNPNIDGDFITQLGSVVEFDYAINGEPTITELITINNLDNEFIFNY